MERETSGTSRQSDDQVGARTSATEFRRLEHAGSAHARDDEQEDARMDQRRRSESDVRWKAWSPSGRQQLQPHTAELGPRVPHFISPRPLTAPSLPPLPSREVFLPSSYPHSFPAGPHPLPHAPSTLHPSPAQSNSHELFAPYPHTYPYQTPHNSTSQDVESSSSIHAVWTLSGGRGTTPASQAGPYTRPDTESNSSRGTTSSGDKGKGKAEEDEQHFYDSANTTSSAPTSGTKQRKRKRKANEEPRDITERRFVCRECRKSFARPSALATHELSHSKLQPHICPFPTCRRPFSVASNLRRHQRLYDHHSSDLPPPLPPPPPPPPMPASLSRLLLPWHSVLASHDTSAPIFENPDHEPLAIFDRHSSDEDVQNEQETTGEMTEPPR